MCFWQIGIVEEDWIFAYVHGDTRFPGGGDITDDALFADTQPMFAFQHSAAAFAVCRTQDRVFMCLIEQEYTHVIEAKFFTDDACDLWQKLLQIANGCNGLHHLCQ